MVPADRSSGRLKEGYTHVSSAPLVPYSGDYRTGLTVEVIGDSGVRIEPVQIRDLVRLVRNQKIPLQKLVVGRSAGVQSDLDEWDSVCNCVFHYHLSAVLESSISIRQAVCVLAALAGEGILEFKRGPAFCELQKIQELTGQTIIYSANSRAFCLAVLEVLEIQSMTSLYTEARPIPHSSFPSELLQLGMLPAGDSFNRFYQLALTGHTVGCYGLFEIFGPRYVEPITAWVSEGRTPGRMPRRHTLDYFSRTGRSLDDDVRASVATWYHELDDRPGE